MHIAGQSTPVACSVYSSRLQHTSQTYRSDEETSKSSRSLATKHEDDTSLAPPTRAIFPEQVARASPNGYRAPLRAAKFRPSQPGGAPGLVPSPTASLGVPPIYVRIASRPSGRSRGLYGLCSEGCTGALPRGACNNMLVLCLYWSDHDWHVPNVVLVVLAICGDFLRRPIR